MYLPLMKNDHEPEGPNGRSSARMRVTVYWPPPQSPPTADSSAVAGTAPVHWAPPALLTEAAVSTTVGALTTVCPSTSTETRAAMAPLGRTSRRPPVRRPRNL